MQVAWIGASWHCGVMETTHRSNSLLCESEGWWFKSPSGQYFYHGCFFHYALQLHDILQDFLLPRDGSHLSTKQKNSECQIFYFLTFSAERSKFLERTLFWPDNGQKWLFKFPPFSQGMCINFFHSIQYSYHSLFSPTHQSSRADFA